MTRKSEKIYIVGYCTEDGIIHGVHARAHRNWFNAIERADNYQKILNARPQEKRRAVVIGVRRDYVNDKIEGTILKKINGHHYLDTEWN